MKARVTVCRGCCCGTDRKHPQTDHPGQLEQLTRAGVSVRVAECLDVCEHSNVLVVHGRGRRSVWLGGVLDAVTTEHVATWVAQGGPMPVQLQPFIIERPKRA